MELLKLVLVQQCYTYRPGRTASEIVGVGGARPTSAIDIKYLLATAFIPHGYIDYSQKQIQAKSRQSVFEGGRSMAFKDLVETAIEDGVYSGCAIVAIDKAGAGSLSCDRQQQQG